MVGEVGGKAPESWTSWSSNGCMFGCFDGTTFQAVLHQKTGTQRPYIQHHWPIMPCVLRGFCENGKGHWDDGGDGENTTGDRDIRICDLSGES